MTTSVLVINRGKGEVKIEVQSRGGDGRFKAMHETHLAPGGFLDLVVHDHQSFQVYEVPAEGGTTEGAPV